MARPSRKFTPERASSLVTQLNSKLTDSDYCEKNLRFPENSRYEDHWNFMVQAKDELDKIAKLLDETKPWSKNPKPIPDDIPELVKEWLDQFMSDKGWERFLSNERQKKTKNKSFSDQDKQVALPRMAAYYLAEMADELDVDRKVFVDSLVHYLRFDDAGEEFLKSFVKKMRGKQQKDARDCLSDVFTITNQDVNVGLIAAIKNKPGQDEDILLSVFRLGKPKLIQIAKALRPLTGKAAFAKAAHPDPSLNGLSLLEHASKKKGDEVKN